MGFSRQEYWSGLSCPPPILQYKTQCQKNKLIRSKWPSSGKRCEQPHSLRQVAPNSCAPRGVPRPCGRPPPPHLPHRWGWDSTQEPTLPRVLVAWGQQPWCGWDHRQGQRWKISAQVVNSSIQAKAKKQSQPTNSWESTSSKEKSSKSEHVRRLVVSDSATPWTVACQVSLSMEFPRKEYWSGLPFRSIGDLPDPGIELGSPALKDRFFTNWATREVSR